MIVHFAKHFVTKIRFEFRPLHPSLRNLFNFATKQLLTELYKPPAIILPKAQEQPYAEVLQDIYIYIPPPV